MNQKIIPFNTLKDIVLSSGADDCGIVDINRNSIKEESSEIKKAFPKLNTLISFVLSLNKNNLRSIDGSLRDIEYSRAYKKLDEISYEVSRILRKSGFESITPSAAFPQDMNKWPGRMWTISHKIVAEEAGLGIRGHNRLLLHKDFGPNICLNTMGISAISDKYDEKLKVSPCVNCGLCTGICPTGAIGRNGEFDFLKCFFHVYRDRLGGFINWIESIVSSENMDEYKKKRDDSETLSVWQALTHSGGYRCSYCMAVCPAGRFNQEEFFENKKKYIKEVFLPLKNKPENIYGIQDDAFVSSFKKRFKTKVGKSI